MTDPVIRLIVEDALTREPAPIERDIGRWMMHLVLAGHSIRVRPAVGQGVVVTIGSLEHYGLTLHEALAGSLSVLKNAGGPDFL